MDIYVKMINGRWLLTKYTDPAMINTREFREYCFKLAQSNGTYPKLSSNGDFELKLEYNRRLAN